MDRDAMRDQLNAQALSPLHFLNDDTRLQFWKLLDSCRDTIEARTYGSDATGQETKELSASTQQRQDLLVQIERLKGVIDVQAIDIQSARDQIVDLKQSSRLAE